MPVLLKISYLKFYTKQLGTKTKEIVSEFGIRKVFRKLINFFKTEIKHGTSINHLPRTTIKIQHSLVNNVKTFNMTTGIPKSFLICIKNFQNVLFSKRFDFALGFKHGCFSIYILITCKCPPFSFAESIPSPSVLFLFCWNIPSGSRYHSSQCHTVCSSS